MTTEQFYEKIGGDYSGILSRLGSEEMIKRFILKFPKDSSFIELSTAFKERDAQSAFRASHTLKGICANLSFDRLYRPVYELTESLRGNEFSENSDDLFGEIIKEYQLLVEAIDEICV